jgi:hypothetical protein
MIKKSKLAMVAVIICLLCLNACNDKKEYVEKIRESSELESETTAKVEQKTESEDFKNIDSAEAAEVAEVPDENPIIRDKDGVAIGLPFPSRPGFVISPFTNKMVDLRGIPAGTKVRDPSDPNPEHVFRVPGNNQ